MINPNFHNTITEQNEVQSKDYDKLTMSQQFLL